MAYLLRRVWHPAAVVVFHSLLSQKARYWEHHLNTLLTQGLNGSAESLIFQSQQEECVMKTFTSQVRFLLTLFAAILAMLLVTSNAEAKSSWLQSFHDLYGTSGTQLDTCGLCHVNFMRNSALNDYGLAFRAAGGTSDQTGAFIALEKNDPDKDTVSSLDEIDQLFLPGWNCKTIEAASSAPSYVTDYVDPSNPGCWGANGPAIAVTPLVLDFEAVEVGTNVTLMTTISNEGNSDLTVSNLSISGSGDFALNAAFSTTPFTVAPGQSEEVLVNYTPGETGDDAGILEILSDDPDTSVLSVNLAGTGFAPRSLLSDLDITGLRANKRLSLRREKPVKIKVVVVNKSGTSGSADVSLVGYDVNQNKIFSGSQRVTNLAQGERATLLFQSLPPGPGVLTWKATIQDDDPDDDTATATTKIVP